MKIGIFGSLVVHESGKMPDRVGKPMSLMSCVVESNVSWPYRFSS